MKSGRLRRKVLDMLRSDRAAVSISIGCVQGVPIVSLLLFSFIAAPELLGSIRWLESMIALALIVVSLGLPSISLRRAALDGSVATTGSILLNGSIAGVWTTLFLAVMLVPFYKHLDVSVDAFADAWTVCLLAVTLLAAQSSRLALAIQQGRCDLRATLWKLAMLASAAVLSLPVLAMRFGALGWMAGRILFELGLLVVLARAVIPPGSFSSVVKSIASSEIIGLLRAGLSVNYSIVLRVVADNLPLILLGFAASSTSELGLFSFANLLMFVPLFHIAVLSQSALPELVGAINGSDSDRLARCLAAFSRDLLVCAWIWGLFMVMAAAVLSGGLALTDYSSAAPVIVLLAMGLWGRTIIFRAGAVNVATGNYGASALMAISEIVVISVCFAIIPAPNATVVAGVVLASFVPSVVYARRVLRAVRPTGVG